MVDVLSARLQDVYTKWESRSEPRLVKQTNARHLSYGGLRRHGNQERHRRRVLAREVSREVREQTLSLCLYRFVIDNLENVRSSVVTVNKQVFWEDRVCK